MNQLNTIAKLFIKASIFLGVLMLFIFISTKTTHAQVVYDTSTASHTSGNASTSEASFGWSHTGGASPEGVVVFVYTIISESPYDTAVTYGGTSMTLVSGGAATATGGEAGVVRTYFLGSSVPTGTQTVTVTRTSNTIEMWAVASTVDAATDTEVYTTGIVLLQSSALQASEQNVDDGSPGVNSVRFAGLYSGHKDVPLAGTNSTKTFDNDLGNYSAGAAYETTAGQGSRPVGLTMIAADEAAGVHLAVREAPPTSDFSGTIYQTDESSAYDCSTGGPYTVRLRVNGGGTYSGDCDQSSGAWAVTGVTVTSGQTIYAYIYNETPKGTTVLVSDATTLTDLHIFQDRVIVRDDVNSSITNTEVLAGNTADADDLITTSGADVTVSSSYETHIYTSDTYAPGANVETGKLHVVGSYSGATETLTLTGSGTGTSRPLYVNGGTFTTPDITTFQGTAATDIEATTFDALNFTPTITGAVTYKFLGAETINGNFNVNPTASTAQTLTVELGGTTTVGASYTTTLTGTTSGLSILDTRPVTTDYNLSTGLLNIAAAGTLDAGSSASTITLTGTSGTLFTYVSGFTAGSSTVVFNPNASVTLFSGTPTLYNLSLTPTLATSGKTYSVGAALTINGDFTINPDATALLLTVDMGGDITVASGKTTSITRTNTATSSLATTASNYNLSTGLLNIATGGTLTAASSTSNITLTGTSGTLFTLGGTFTEGTSTVIFNPDAAVTLFSATPTLYNLSLTPTITSSLAYTVGSALTINGDFTVNPTAGSAYLLTVNAGGNITAAATSTTTLTGTTSGTSTLDLRPVTTDYNLSTGLLDVAASGALDATGAASTITLTSTSGTLFTLGEVGDFTAGSSTVTVTSASGTPTLNSGSITFNTLTINASGATIGSSADAVTINTNLNINGGTFAQSGAYTVAGTTAVATGTTYNINNTLDVTGSLTTTGTGIINTTAGTPTVTVQGTTIGGGSGAITFYALTKSGAGTTTFSGSGTNTINNNLSVSAGTLTQSDTLTVTGDGSVATGATLNINADLNINGGALTTAGTGIINTTAGTPNLTMSGTGNLGSGSGAISLYALTTSGTGTTTFSGSGTNTIANNVSVGTGTTLNIDDDVSIAGTLTKTTTGIIGTSAGTPTITLTGTGALGGGSGAITFHHLITSGTGTFTFTGTGTNNANGNITVGSGTTLNINDSISIAGNFTNTTDGIIGNSAGSPTVTMTNNTSSSIGGGSGAITIYNLATTGTGTHTFTGSGTNTFSNNVAVGTGTTLNINNSASVGGALTNTTTGIIGYSGTPTITMTGTGNLGSGSGAISLYALTTSGTGTITFSGSGTNTIANNVSVGSGTTLNINDDVSIAGTLTKITTGTIGTTAGTPTVTLTGTGTLGGGSGAITFHHLTTSGTGTHTFTGSGTNTANGNITIGSGTTLNINDSISIAGNFTNTSTGIIGYSGTPTLTMTGTGALGSGSGAISLYALTTSGTGTITFSGSGTNTIANNVSVGTGTTLNINDDVSIAGTLTNTTTGVIGTSAGTPTITLTGSGSIGSGSGAITFHHLTTSGTGTFTFTGSGTNNANGNITVGTGTTLNINDSISIAGTLINTTTGVIATSAGTPTVTLTGTGNLGSGSGDITFHHLSTSGTGTHTFTGSGTNAFNGNITVGTGTTLNLNSSASIAGNLINTTTGIIGYSGTPTITMTGNSNSIGGGAGAIDFYNLTIDGTVITANSDTDVANTLNIAASDKLTIADAKTVTVASTGSLTLTNEIDGTGTLVYQSTTTFPATGTMTAPVQFDSTAGAQTLSERTYVGNIEFYNNSGVGRSYQLGTAGSQTLTFSGNFTLDGNSGTVTVDADTQDPTVNITGGINYTAAGSAESITTGTGTWTVGGDVNFTNGTFTATVTNTFLMNGTSDLTSNGQAFQNFEVQTNTVTSLDTMDVDGTFDVSSNGTFVHAGGAGSDLYVADDFTLASGTTFTSNSEATSQVIFDGDLFLADNTAVKQNLGDVVIGTSPDTTYLSADTSANSLTVTSADFYYTCGHEVDIGNGGITIDGTFDATSDEAGCSVYDGADPETTINDGNLFNLSGTGTFVPDQSTIIFDDSSGLNNLTTAGTGSFYNMEVDGAANTMVLQDALDINNNLTITQGELDAGTAYQLNVGGNWTNDGTFDHQNGLVVLDGITSTNLDSGCADYDTCTNEDFYDLEINKTAGTDDVTLLNTHLRVTDNLTITDGELIQGTLNVRVEDTSVSGTAVTVTSNGTWTNTSTGNLKLAGGFSNAGTATFQGNGSGCGDNDDLAIASTDTTDRNWSGSGTFNVNDVTCSDQISTPTINAYSSTNSGSSCGANWNFVGCPLDVSGNVYNFGTSSALTECDADGGTYELRLRVASTTQSASCDDATGAFTFSSVPGPTGGDGLVMWIDDAEASETDGALVTRYDGTGGSANNIFYDDAVTITSDDTNAVDILDMNFYDNGDDADIPYTATATPTLSVNSGYELLVKINSGVAGGSDVFDPGGTVTIVGNDDFHIDDNSKAYLDTATNDLNGDITIDTGATLSIDADTTMSGATSGDIAATGTLATSGTPDVTMSVDSSISGGGTVNLYDLSLATSGTTTINTTTTVTNSVDVGAGTTLTVGANLNIDSTSGTGGLTTASTGIVGYSGTPTVDIDNAATLGGGSGEIKFYDLDLGDGVADTTTLSSTIIVENSLTVNTNQLFAMGTNDVTVGATGVSGSGDITHNGTSSHSASGTFTIKSSSGGTAQFTGAGELDVYNLTLGDGVTSITVDNESNDIVLDIANNFENTTGSTFQASSTAGFNIRGDWTNSGTFTSGTGTVTMDAQDAGNTLSGTMTGSSSFNNLTFDDNGTPATWTFAANSADVTNNFIITDGTVTAPSTTLTIGGLFTNNDAFAHNSGTIVFNDSGKTSTLTYAATTTFNNFTVATGGKQMEFDNSDGVITDIDGALSLQGSGCDAGRIFLDPDSAGLEWDIAASGSVDIDYIDVEYSAASPALTAESSTEQNNNNTGWTINAGICGAKETRFLDGVRIRGGVRAK